MVLSDSLRTVCRPHVLYVVYIIINLRIIKELLPIIALWSVDSTGHISLL